MSKLFSSLLFVFVSPALGQVFLPEYILGVSVEWRLNAPGFEVNALYRRIDHALLVGASAGAKLRTTWRRLRQLIIAALSARTCSLCWE